MGSVTAIAPALSPSTSHGQHRVQKSTSGPRRTKWRSRARAAKLCTIAIVVLAGLRIFVGDASVVPTASMQNTVMVGDHLLWIKALDGPEIPVLHWRLPRLRHVRRGEIIAFRYPLDPQQVYLKRAVAIGGDRVEIRGGVVWVNGAGLRETYVLHSGPPDNDGRLEQMPPRTVPAGRIFVLGDNRDNSSDSREWGAVPEQNVLGSPIMILWSYDAPPAQWLDWSLAHQVRFYCAAIPHLFTRTRWSRMFTLL